MFRDLESTNIKVILSSKWEYSTHILFTRSRKNEKKKKKVPDTQTFNDLKEA